MEDIEIVDVALSPPRLDAPDVEHGACRAWTEVVITVRNPAPQTTLFVRADNPALHYEAETGTLKLVLAELPPHPDLHFAFVRQPAFLPVLPGTTAAIRTAIPIELNVLDVDTLDHPRLKKVDLSEVQQVEVTVNYDSTPFRPVHTDPAQVIRKQLHAWGRRMSCTHVCRLPPAEADISLPDY